MSNLIRVWRHFVLAFILTGCCVFAKAQFSPVESKNGFSLQKGTSLSSVKTGDIFTYTVNFSIPAGAMNVFIIDNLPSPLVIDAITVAPNYSSFVPVVTQTTSSVTLFFNSVTTSISGSFQVHAHFPVDSGCNGRRVTNVAELRAELPQTYLVTKGVDVTSIVDNPWRVQKYPNGPGLTYLGSNCYGVISDTVDFTIRVVKQNWTVSGSASWYNVSLNDILPAGAIVIPTSYVPNANLAGSSITAGGNILLPSGFKLDANANNVYLATFKIRHTPILDTNNCVINTAILGGKDACNVQHGDTSKVGVKKMKPAPQAVLQKWVNVNGNLPGCTGTYTIRVCNIGTAPLPAYTLTDVFPSCLTGVTLASVTPGCTATPAGPNTFNFAGPSIPVGGGCHVYTFNFTIGTGCPSVITNTVTATSGFSGSASANIWMLPPGPTACLNKSICSPLPTIYTPGTVVRFRLRVQNIGGSPMTGASIFDQLDVSNLEYVGNEVYYSWPTPFAPCGTGNAAPSGSTPWPGVSPSHVVSSGTLKWSLPTIGVECDNIPYPACGFAYGLTAYYIEFSVKIKDTAGLGNIKNCADISGTGLTTVTSCVTFVTKGTLNYNASKMVSNDNGATFSSLVTANAGATVQYKLMSTNMGIPLINPVLVDLLPRDNGTNDQFIISCGPRGSVYDIRYSSFVSSSHTFSSQLFSTVAGANTTPELGVTCFPNAPGWAAPFAGAANLRTQLSQAISLAPPLAYVFNATTSTTALENQVACNSYALRGAAKYIINYVTTYPLQTPLESGTACVKIKKNCCNPVGFTVPTELCINKSYQFCVQDTCHPQNQYVWNFGDGTPDQVGVCVTHTYTSTGSFVITVKWHDDCGDHIKEFVVKVDKCCCDPIGFDIPKDVCLNISTNYCVQDTCNPHNTYYWDFGDGTPQQTGLCVSHTYTGLPASYIVTVKWHDDCGDHVKEFGVTANECHCDVKTKFTVQTSGLTITADGTATTSSFPIAIYVWDFGDGSFGTGPIVNHTYASNGWYVLKLTVYTLDAKGNICECKDECRVEIYVDQDKESIFYCNIQNKGVEKSVSDVTLRAAPNPFRDNITVNFDFVNKAKFSDQTGYQLEFVNANGVVLQSKKLRNLERTVTIDSRMYASGIYFIVLKNRKGEVQNMRVVKL